MLLILRGAYIPHRVNPPKVWDIKPSKDTLMIALCLLDLSFIDISNGRECPSTLSNIPS